MLQHPKHNKFAITAALIGAITAGVTGMYLIPAQSTVTIQPTTHEDQERYNALGAAQRYIVTSPTFAFDGDINTLKTEYVGSTKSIPPQHMISATFDSSHGGFGDREGQILTQAITPHKVHIIVSEGNVISAVTDDSWDEINHQYILKKPQPKLPSHDEAIAPFDGQLTDYSSLIDAIKARGVLVEPIDELEDSVFSVPAKTISVGGAVVQVFEFQNEPDAQKSSLMISKDGTEIGTSMIRWMDTPHFYTKGKIIILYVGQNPEIKNLFESLLGQQFAGM
ncbi:MAG TPA: hypothetical protein VLF17_02615 [Candidatus Nitrosotenuis sp.]|nr:hypothetical protein [Candidatus Nitrosotenuis sp.]